MAIFTTGHVIVFPFDGSDFTLERMNAFKWASALMKNSAPTRVNFVSAALRH